LSPPYYLNGLTLSSSTISPLTTSMHPRLSELKKFKTMIRGLQFFEDLVPMNCALISQIIDTKEDLVNNYCGQLYVSSGNLANDLRYCYIDLD
jgi:hypothetical protein